MKNVLNNIKVSIIVPVYNSEKYLQTLINSLIAQTLKEIEIIVIDDGSTDSSGKILDDYQSELEKIKVIHKQNAGVSAARNTGLEVASGEYIGFVDSDDWIEKDMYEKLYNTAKLKNCNVVICNFERN